MPLYSFRCPSCGLEKDENIPLAKFDEPQICGCTAVLDRIITGAPAVHFIGHTGFRTSGDRNGGWDWSKPKARAIEGHEMSSDEKNHVIDTTTKKYIKQVEGVKNDISKQ